MSPDPLLVGGVWVQDYTLREVSIPLFNHLTTDDAFWHCLTLAACYQLTQSVLKIGSALAEMVGQGEVSGCTALGDSAWGLLQLAVEKPWSTPGEQLAACNTLSHHWLQQLTLQFFTQGIKCVLKNKLHVQF